MKIFKALKISILIFFMIPVAVLTVHAGPRVDTLNERTSLAGDWKIKLGDDKRYALKNFDDTGWDTIHMPGNFIYYTKKHEKTAGGIVWLRKKIYISKDIEKQNIGLILGKIAHADETYCNGTLIGKMGTFPPDDFSMWNHPRFYMIPEQNINFGGENEISLRVYYYGYGQMIGDLAVTGFDDWNKESKNQNFLSITMAYIIISLGFPFGFIFLIFYLVRRDEEYMYYVLQLIFGFFIVFNMCSYWNIYGTSLFRTNLLIFAWVGLNVAHPIFLHRIYSLHRKKVERTLWGYLLLVAVVLFSISGKEIDQVKLISIIVVTLMIGGYNVSCHISALYKKRPYAKLFSFFGISVILGAIHDGIVEFNKYTGLQLRIPGFTFENMIFHYSALILMVGTALVLVYRFANVMDEVEDLNLNLEKKVTERTDELSKANEEIEAAMAEMEALNENLIEINTELERSERIHEIDMWMAGNVQSTFLPARAPVSDIYDIAFIFKPLTSVSGDFYDFYLNGDTIEGVGLFDVSGHGISSGLITLLAKSIIYHNFIDNRDMKLNKIMERINNEFIDEINDSDSYVTGVLLRLRNDTVEYANSGHPDILYRPVKDNKTVMVLDKDGNSIGGPFLGFDILKKPFKSLEFKLQKGDCLFLYSDCLYESLNSHDEIYGIERIIESMDRVKDGTAQEMLDAMQADFNGFIGKNELIKDDLTMIFIKKIS